MSAPKRRKETARQWATAYHEAGHAIVREWLGAGAVWYVAIGPQPGDEESTGACAAQDPPAIRFMQPDDSLVVQSRKFGEEITICYAGPVAERRATGRPSGGGASSDVQRVRGLLGLVGIEGNGEMVHGHAVEPIRGAARAWAKAGRDEATALLAQPDVWGAVDALAAELVAHRVVAGRRVREIVRAAGRDVQEPRFVKALPPQWSEHPARAAARAGGRGAVT